MLEACWKRQEWHNELAITQAWLTAKLGFCDPKKFPPIDKLTGKKRAPAKQTPEQMLAAVRALKAIFEGDDDGGSS